MRLGVANSGEVKRHQLAERRVGGGEAGLHVGVEGQIQPREQRAGLQGVLLGIACGVIALHGNIGKGQRCTAARQTALRRAADLHRRIVLFQMGLLLLGIEHCAHTSIRRGKKEETGLFFPPDVCYNMSMEE